MKDDMKNLAILNEKIHEILLNEWDPIGVRGVFEAQDEYDIYISTIFNLLNSEKSQNELFEYLWWIETNHMGLVGDRKQTEKISKKLKDLFQNQSPDFDGFRNNRTEN